MKAFEGIDIDPKFIDATYGYIKAKDTDNNGHSVE